MVRPLPSVPPWDALSAIDSVTSGMKRETMPAPVAGERQLFNLMVNSMRALLVGAESAKRTARPENHLNCILKLEGRAPLEGRKQRRRRERSPCQGKMGCSYLKGQNIYRGCTACGDDPSASSPRAAALPIAENLADGRSSSSKDVRG